MVGAGVGRRPASGYTSPRLPQCQRWSRHTLILAEAASCVADTRPPRPPWRGALLRDTVGADRRAEVNSPAPRPARAALKSAARERRRGFRAKRVPVSGFGHAGRGVARSPVRDGPTWASAKAHSERRRVRGGTPGGPVQAFLSIAVSRPTPACSRFAPLALRKRLMPTVGPLVQSYRISVSAMQS